MSRIFTFAQVKFKDVLNLDGTHADNFFQDYLNTVGLLNVYESKPTDRGQWYIYFYPSEPDNDMQRYFHSSVGTLSQDDGEIRLKSNHEYVFEIVDELSDIRLADLLLTTGIVTAKLSLAEVSQIDVLVEEKGLVDDRDWDKLQMLQLLRDKGIVK